LTNRIGLLESGVLSFLPGVAEVLERLRKSIELAKVRRKRAECVRQGLTQEHIDAAYQVAFESIGVASFFGDDELQSQLSEKFGKFNLDPATIYLLVQLVILIWKAYQWAKENGLLSDGNPFGNSADIRELIEGK
jgi:hypothetical protein